MRHDNDVFPGLVVHVTVGENRVEVLDAFFGGPVVVVLQSLLDGAKVHGVLDDLVIVGDIELDGVDGAVEGPAELVLPDGLHDGVLQVLELVGVAARAVRWGYGGWMNLSDKKTKQKVSFHVIKIGLFTNFEKATYWYKTSYGIRKIIKKL